MDITLEQAISLIPQINESEGLFLSAPQGYNLISADSSGTYFVLSHGRKTPRVLATTSEVVELVEGLSIIEGLGYFWYSNDETITDAPIEEVFEDYDAPVWEGYTEEEDYDGASPANP